MTAESSALAGGSVDPVTVAQALHWLHRPAFYAEVRRVLAPGGVVVFRRIKHFSGYVLISRGGALEDEQPQ